MSLQRFIDAQNNTYADALNEISNGKKQSHWMWFIFPQLKGLGRSETANYYGIKDFKEARDFLQHPILGQRLKEITSALNGQSDSDPHSVFGSPDDLKLQSSLTLFALADGSVESVFTDALAKFFNSEQDQRTLEILNYNQSDRS
ncbi:DUF1810 domain-containing protein [Kaistella rhinocerotis]|uniref:DUF1810 domain-containing protein n=1 Tax=Kaistella rhinocerotis TaxID=3026437 RepID=UPI0025523ADF|nr:DUF1810 domain-containing protein [Kaistella sp. Ran72]